MQESTKLNYVEFASLDVSRSKTFFENAFNWRFTDYGSEYSAFSNAGLDGGIFESERVSQAESGAPLLVLYANNITDAQRRIEKAGGTISKPLFDFPGGCRFHFIEPGGNELAVWSESAK
ncbi:VOC family protein [Alteromonas gracilis]|uniref:VOC family protein n=1 Tax=Alteromonas gracilis TaxID=1479524 RepID=UPI0037369BBC